MTTAAAAAGGASSGQVRPFASRVVQQEWAAAAVAPSVDALGQDEHRPFVGVPLTAYEPSPPALYVYRMRQGSGDHLGVVAEVPLVAFATGGVRGHESVEQHRVDALVRYYADHPGRSEPVALLHEQDPSATSRVEEVCRGRPLLRFEGSDGLEHTLWRVTGAAETSALAAALGDRVRYIADGHHRVAARLRAWERAGKPDGAGVLCVLYPMDGLTMSAFHRRLCGPVDGAVLLDAASAHFRVRPVEAGQPTTGIGLYVAGRWYDLVTTRPRSEGVAGLDVSVLHAHLLSPVLGVSGARHDRLEVVPDRVPLRQSTARCDDDRGALFVLRPPSLRALTRIADLGQEMPPKTTYFAPKPQAGIFLT